MHGPGRPGVRAEATSTPAGARRVRLGSRESLPARALLEPGRPSFAPRPGVPCREVSAPPGDGVLSYARAGRMPALSGGRALSLTTLMEPPMFGLMEPLTGAALGSRRG